MSGLKSIVITILICICVPAVASYSQKSVNFECPPGSVCDFFKFDEFGFLSWKDEKARLDNVANQFNMSPADFAIYLVGYSKRGTQPSTLRKRMLHAKRYLM